MSDQEPHVDLAVVGSGPGGYRAAVLGALRGLRVAIVERGVWGGCCLNRGCVPKKDWHHSAMLIHQQARGPARGVRGHLAGDLDEAWAHQREVVARVRQSYLDYLGHLGVRKVAGSARLGPDGKLIIDPVAGTTNGINVQRPEPFALDAAHVIIGTGSAPIVPPPFPSDSPRILTTDDLFESPPPAGQRIGLIGSGVVATELAFILTMLGREVHWLTRSEPLHRARFSPSALRVLYGELEQCGIVRHRGEVAAVAESAAGIRLDLRDGDPIEVDWVLLGTGRRPHTAGLGLEEAGVRCGPGGFIERSAWAETTRPGVYAIGDVASPLMNANQAMADATVALTNVINPQSRRLDPDWVPEVVYSAIELARLGMDEDAAEDAGREPAVGFAAFESSPTALGQDAPEGFVRLVADLDDGRLLGGEVVGGQAGELIHQLAARGNRDGALAELASGAVNHPSRSEEFVNATETLAHKWGLGERVFASFNEE